MADITEMLKGVLEGCILEIISRQETYGYEITKRLHAMGFSDIAEGTVYTVLVRLEKRGFVKTYKKTSKTGPMRKFYTLNDSGSDELKRFWEKWTFLTERIKLLRKYNSDETAF